MVLARHDVQVIVQHNELEHALVRPVRIVGQTIAEVTVAAFGVRMAGFLLHLFAGHRELGRPELCHAVFVRMAGNTPVARLVAGIEEEEQQNEGELDEKDAHPALASEKIPESADSHRLIQYHNNALDKILFMLLRFCLRLSGFKTTTQRLFTAARPPLVKILHEGESFFYLS